MTEYRFFTKIFYVCLRPREFFDSIKYDFSLWSAVKFYSAISIISILLNIVLSAIIFPSGLNRIPAFLLQNLYLISLTLVIIPFYHLFVYIFGGRNGIGKTFGVFLYASSPVVMVSWIPLLPFIVVFYSVYISIIGLKILQEVSFTRALLAYFIPFLILAVSIILKNIT